MKQILSIAFFTILAFNLSAQKFYLGFQTSYGLATSTGQANLRNVESINETSTYKTIRGGLGEGLTIGTKAGYRFHKYLNIELSAAYLFGRELSAKEYSEFSNGMELITSEYIKTYQAQSLQISPQLVFKIPTNSKINPYAKIGLTFGCFTKINSYESNSNTGGFVGNYKREYSYITKGNISTGVNTALGANYSLNDKIALYFEFQLLNMSYAPKTILTTKYLINNTDYFDNLSMSEKEKIYVNEIIRNDNIVIDPDEPGEKLRVLFPFSNLSLNVGLNISL